MNILNFIFLGIIIYISLKFYLYRKDIAKLSEDLAFINREKLDVTKLRTATRARELEALLDEINKVLEEKQDLDFNHRQREKEVKEAIASISHDLRTPLTSIKGYADLLSSSLDDEKELEYIEIIRARSRSLEDLIASFYELSKLELRDYDYELDYVDLGELLREVLLSFYDRLEARGLEPIVDIDPGEHRVLGDRKALERVFINLVDNGIKYSKSYFKVSLKKIGPMSRLDFINDSYNIREEDVGKIFNKFFVMDTSRQSESTGLGLYISKEILRDLGYDIATAYDQGKIDIYINFKRQEP